MLRNLKFLITSHYDKDKLDSISVQASPPVQKRTGSKKWGHLNRKSLTSASNSLVSLCTGSDGVAKVSILRQIIEDTGKRQLPPKASEVSICFRLFFKKINPFLKSNPPTHQTAVFEILLLFCPYNHDYSKRKQGSRKWVGMVAT